MPSLKDVKPATRIKAMHVGRSGGGKTIGAASLAQIAPEGQKIFIFDLDGRIRPVVKMYPQLLDKIDYESYGPSDFAKLWDKVGWLSDHPNDYWGVVMDGLTVLADMTMTYSMELAGNSKSSKMMKGVIPLPEIQDYKAEIRGVSGILDELRNYPRHLILTAHLVSIEYNSPSKTQASNDKKIERILVTQGRKLAPIVPRFFDEIYLFLPSVSGVLGNLPDYKVYTAPNEYFEECRTALSLPASIPWTMKPGELGLYPKIMEHVKKMDASMASKILES